MGPLGCPKNVGKELSLFSAQYLRRAQNSQDNLVLQAMVWLRIIIIIIFNLRTAAFEAYFAI
jgi:hypothetical protein